MKNRDNIRLMVSIQRWFSLTEAQMNLRSFWELRCMSALNAEFINFRDPIKYFNVIKEGHIHVHPL